MLSYAAVQERMLALSRRPFCRSPTLRAGTPVRGVSITPTSITVRDRGSYRAQNLSSGVTYAYTQNALGICVYATKDDTWGGVNNSVVSVQFNYSITLT